MILNDDNVSDRQQSPTTNETGLQDQTIGDITKQKDDATLFNPVEEISIYNIRTKLRRNLILVVIAIIAFLLPFCDSIYLPALRDIGISLNTTDTLVVISVSIYLFMSGLLSLVWGSSSDRFGRKITMIIALIIFVAASAVCIFAPNIIVLIVFRGIEGGAISATLVIGQSLVADIYPHDQRGTASGFFFLPFNVGPIIGPLIGGPLSDAAGWRSTFVLLTASGIVAVIAILIFIPETHQYFVKERFHKENPNKRIIDVVINEKPTFGKPWKSLIYLTDLTLLPYITVSAMSLATLFTSSTLFPLYLSDAPYNYTGTKIGLLYIPSGVSLFIGSIFGGWVSDKSSKHYGHEKYPEGRLVPALILSILIPVGLVIYGWVLNYQLSIVGAIVGQVLIGFSQATVEVTVSAYLTIKKQNEAAAVCATSTFLNCCLAGLILTFAVPLASAMGTGPYFTLLAGVNVISIAWFGTIMYTTIRRTDYVRM